MDDKLVKSLEEKQAKALEDRSKMKVTRPWDKKDAPRPWRRDIFKLKENRKGWRTRWVQVGNVDRRIMDGYLIANKNDYGGTWENPLEHGKANSTVIMRNDLVLMEIPEAMAKEREDAMEILRKKQQDDAKRRVKAQAKKLAREMGIDVPVDDYSGSEKGRPVDLSDTDERDAED